MTRQDSRTPARTENLSSSRGNAFGIGLMKAMMNLLGINRACEFVWVITLFYALFDRAARKRAKPFLRRRFPASGRMAGFFHLWRFFTSQGQALLESFALRTGKTRLRVVGREILTEHLRRPEGFIVASSHFGPWQAMMTVLIPENKRIGVLQNPDRNPNVDKFMATDNTVSKIEIISNEEPFGGLLQLNELLASGNSAGIMVDRLQGGDGVPVQFFGEEALFPAAAFHAAARTEVPLIPVFTCRAPRGHKEIILYYTPPIHPHMKGRDRKALAPYIQEYVSRLEQMEREHPYHTFLFEDIWRHEE